MGLGLNLGPGLNLDPNPTYARTEIQCKNLAVKHN